MSSFNCLSFITRAALASASVLVISTCIAATAHAQQGASPNVLPTLVVSPTSVPTPQAAIASSVTVITAADIEREQRRTVVDILANVPGLNIVQAGGPGSQTSLFTRGTNSNHTKLLIDGIDVSDPSNPGRQFDLGHLLADDIERIEVLRGPQSGLYGADAIGGVISIITKKGKGPAKITGTLEAGSFKTANQSASLSGTKDAFDYAFNVSHFHQGDTPVTPQNLLPAGRAAIGNWYDNVTGSTKLGVDVNENLRINYVGRYTEARLKYTQDEFLPPTFAGVPRAEQSIQDVRQFFTRGEAVVTGFDGRMTNYFGINYTDHWNATRTTPTSLATVNSGTRTKFDWRGVTVLAPGHTLVTGAEHEMETMSATAISAENRNTGVYGQIQSEFAQRVFVVANVRHDMNERFGEATTFRVAPSVILPGSETKLKASYGSGFKAPTLTQMFVNFLPSFLANPNLRPEESLGYDVGFEQPVFGGRVNFGATYFNNDITNLISGTGIVTTVPFTVRTNINIGRAQTDGIEAFVSVNPVERVRLRADYTYTEAFDKVTNLELLRRPRHKATFTAAWNPIDPLNLSATVLHVGSYIDGNRDFSIPRLNTPGYTVVNLAGDYRLDQHAKLFARIDNVFNEKYEDPTGFLRPGIGVYGGIRVSN